MRQVDHFAFQVADMAEALRFYTETLGLKLLFRERDEAHHEEYAFLELAGGNLELLQLLDAHNQPVPYPRPEIRKPYCPHLALQTDDLEGLMALLQERQVPVVEGPLEIPGKVKWLYLSDPDHNIIEFIQWL